MRSRSHYKTGTYITGVCGGNMLFDSQLYVQLEVLKNEDLITLQDGYLLQKDLWWGHAI